MRGSGSLVVEDQSISIFEINVFRNDWLQEILKYYNESTTRGYTGVSNFGAYVTIGDGRVAEFGAAAPVVATFSSRGPDILNSQSQFADVMKPDILAPGYLIWSAWSPIGADESSFLGKTPPLQTQVVRNCVLTRQISSKKLCLGNCVVPISRAVTY